MHRVRGHRFPHHPSSPLIKGRRWSHKLACEALEELEIDALLASDTGEETFGIVVGPEGEDEELTVLLEEGPKLLATHLRKVLGPQVERLSYTQLCLIARAAHNKDEPRRTAFWRVFGRDDWTKDCGNGFTILQRIAFGTIVARAFDVLMWDRSADTEPVSGPAERHFAATG